MFWPNQFFFAQTISAVPLGWHDKHDTLPTLEEFLAVWDVAYEEQPGDDASPEEKKSYQDRMELLEWYVEKYLPRTISQDFYGPIVRTVKKISDKVKIDGVFYICINVLTEAFGQVQYENSREKWIETFKWKREHKFSSGKDRKVPQYNKTDPSTFRFKAKWSDSAVGQGTKWDCDQACATLEMRQETISKWRKNDAAQGYIPQNLAVKISRKALDWDAKEAKLAKKGKRKLEEPSIDAMLEDKEGGDDTFKGHIWDETE